MLKWKNFFFSRTKTWYKSDSSRKWIILFALDGTNRESEREWDNVTELYHSSWTFTYAYTPNMLAKFE